MSINKSYNHLSELCFKYQQDKFYVEKIPHTILSKSQKRFKISPDEKVIAYLDTTILGVGKNGIHFTNYGIRWRNLGGKAEKLAWEDLDEVNSITIQKNVEVYFDYKKTFLLGGGTNYPATLFIELLVSIRDYLKNYSVELLFEEHLLPFYTETNEIKNTCVLFEKYEEAFEINNGLVVKEHIPKNTDEKLREHYHLSSQDNIIAFLSTLPFKKQNGIVVMEDGIYFKEPFVSLYYPWYAFRDLTIMLAEDELIIGKNNVFHLLHCNMDNSEVMLFLRNLQQVINILHDDYVSCYKSL